MLSFFRFPLLAGALLGAGLLLSGPVAHAQMVALTGAVAPHGYDFLTLTTIEGLSKKTAQLLFTPAFQAKTMVPLLPVSVLGSSEEEYTRLTQNALTVNQQLTDLTVAGWELVQVYAVAPASGTGYNPPITRYLFRKAKS